MGHIFWGFFGQFCAVLLWLRHASRYTQKGRPFMLRGTLIKSVCRGDENEEQLCIEHPLEQEAFFVVVQRMCPGDRALTTVLANACCFGCEFPRPVKMRVNYVLYGVMRAGDVKSALFRPFLPVVSLRVPAKWKCCETQQQYKRGADMCEAAIVSFRCWWSHGEEDA